MNLFEWIIVANAYIGLGVFIAKTCTLTHAREAALIVLFWPVVLILALAVGKEEVPE